MVAGFRVLGFRVQGFFLEPGFLHPYRDPPEKWSMDFKVILAGIPPLPSWPDLRYEDNDVPTFP